MFAAAATFAQMFFDAAVEAAKWIATKVLILSILAIALPFALKGVLLWGFQWMINYGSTVGTYLMDYISSISNGAVDVDITLTGVGGYLAIQTGLIDYAAIIFTGWGLYWVVAVLARTPGRL